MVETALGAILGGIGGLCVGVVMGSLIFHIKGREEERRKKNGIDELCRRMREEVDRFRAAGGDKTLPLLLIDPENINDASWLTGTTDGLGKSAREPTRRRNMPMGKNDDERIWRICLRVAEDIYTRMKPTQERAERTARLLFGTAAVESDLKYRRQIGFKPTTRLGGFGLWQMQIPALRDAMAYATSQTYTLHKRVALFKLSDLITVTVADEMAKFLEGKPCDMGILLDPLADPNWCVMARLYYMTVALAIPSSVEGQGRYWLQYWNRGGKGTIERWNQAWRDHWNTRTHTWEKEPRLEPRPRPDLVVEDDIDP